METLVICSEHVAKVSVGAVTPYFESLVLNDDLLVFSRPVSSRLTATESQICFILGNDELLIIINKYINLKSELNRHFSNDGDTAEVFYADHADKLISLIHNSAHLAVLLLQPHLVWFEQ